MTHSAIARKTREVFTIAIFTNRATLTYTGGVTNSNTVTGEILNSLTVSKTPVSDSYAPGGDVTYAISIVNDGAETVADLTVTDDLGGYVFGDETLYPLEYVQGSLLYYQNGVLQPEPAVTAGPPLSVTGVEVPPEGNVTLIYEARVTEYAPLGVGAEITNTVTVEGSCEPLTATAVLPAAGETELTITKAVSPQVVTGCGDLTYTFVIQNAGTQAAGAEAQIVVSDTFDPVLNGLTATLDGKELTAVTDYTYDEATGEFATAAGRITVPTASSSQDENGVWAVVPGVAVLTVTGTL